jgi:chemotaxis protein methyltransferase CheR
MSHSSRISIPVISFDEANRFAHSLRNDLQGFKLLSGLLKQVAGINLPPSEKNKSLMAARLAPLLRQNNLNGYTQLMTLLNSENKALMTEFVNCLTTNTTDFFREPQHFDVLRDVLKDLIRKKHENGSTELRVWCAASSTGQEVYTMAITILECLPPTVMWNLKFLATDIDMDVLRKAASGYYTENDVRSIPNYLLRKYFRPHNTADRKGYVANTHLKKVVTFAPMNLMSPTYPFVYRFDIVFCRNVMIYFDRDGVNHVATRLTKSLAPGGHLFVGHSESGLIKSPDMQSVASAVYRKRGP